MPDVYYLFLVSDGLVDRPRRYLRQHRDAGTLNTTMGRNVIEECKKLKGVSSSVVYVRLFWPISAVLSTSL